MGNLKYLLPQTFTLLHHSVPVPKPGSNKLTKPSSLILRRYIDTFLNILFSSVKLIVSGSHPPLPHISLQHG